MAAVQPTYVDRIIRDPEILVGKPVVKGTRIAVEVVLEYLAHNPNFADLFADYPRLTMEDVQACLLEANEDFPSTRGSRPRADRTNPAEAG